MSEWISVKDRAPINHYHVLVYDTSEGVCRGYVWDNSWSHYPFGCDASGGYLSDVTHWMPLPPPPEKE